MHRKAYRWFVVLTVVVAGLAPFMALSASQRLAQIRFGAGAPFFSGDYLLAGGRALGGALVFWLAAYVCWRRFRGLGGASGRRMIESIEALEGGTLDSAIFLAAALSLFLEMALIRWQVSVFPLLSFYKNFGLLACFAGLGLGYAIADRKSIPLLAVAPLLGIQLFLMLVLKYGLNEHQSLALLASPVHEQLNMGLISARIPSQYGVIYYVLAVLFLLSALALLPVGQLCGRLMMQRGNLRAYGLNLLGSLAGVGLMMAMSALWTPPLLWFAVVFLALIYFFHADTPALRFSAALSLILLMALAWPFAPEVQRIHSPYQLIEREYTPDGLTSIRAAGHFFQRVHNFSPAVVAASPDVDVKRRARFYELPHRVAQANERVVIVGAGTGNDTAAAIRMGASKVDAVEIDPAIAAIGRAAHPERPYDNPAVRTIINDARSFFRNSQEAYDLIVYGVLDSHAVLSSSASVRLDSFVYTVEGFQEARQRLAPGGLLCLSFHVLSPELGHKIFLMLQEAFDGRAPRCLKARYSAFYMYLQPLDGAISIPPEALDEAQFTDVSQELAESPLPVDCSTDDWPFFYMPYRVYPFSYLGMVAISFGLTLVLIAGLGKGKLRPRHTAFFFLGAGFMLIETKAITELGLQFGNTWQVIGLVISSILCMAFAANALAAKLTIRGRYWPYACLLASLAVGFGIAQQGGFGSSLAGRLGSLAILTCPIFFSGLIFSKSLKEEGDISGVMAANLMGAMAGGLLEYNAMRFGYASLYLLAGLLYLLAGLSWLAAQKRAA